MAPNPPNPPHHDPPPPPPPGRGGGGGGKGKGKGGRPNRARQTRINLAWTNLQNALIAKGFSSHDAGQFARMALTQKGVEIGRGGRVHYKGGVYNANQFVTNPLIQYVTGAKAKAANEATIKADPNYQQALANLALTRDQQQAAITQQRSQALTDFGDPTFVQGDPALAAAAGANPFGTSQLLQNAYATQQRSVAANANQIGTNFGGGQTSGNIAAQRQFAGQQSGAVTALQNLLNGLSLQSSQLGQDYTLGSQNALVQSQQNLQQQGLLSKSAPKIKFGTYNLFRAPKAGQHGGGGPPHAPPPPRAPRRLRQPLQGGNPPRAI